MIIVTLLMIFAAPAVCFSLVAKALDRLCGNGGSRPSRRSPKRSTKADLERFGRDLRRLAAEHDRLLGTDSPSTAFRLRTVGLAYDDTLRTACEELHLDVPGDPMRAVERLQAEAELVVRGVAW